MEVGEEACKGLSVRAPQLIQLVTRHDTTQDCRNPNARSLVDPPPLLMHSIATAGRMENWQSAQLSFPMKRQRLFEVWYLSLVSANFPSPELDVVRKSGDSGVLISL